MTGAPLPGVARTRLALLVAVAVMLGLGIGLKVLAARHRPEDPTPLRLAAARAFLEGQGLSVTGQETTLDLHLLTARKGEACRLVLALLAPQGWHGGVLRTLGQPGDDLFFVLDGHATDAQPVWRARLALYGALLQTQFGITARPPALLGIVARPACGARDYPWSQIEVR